MTSQKQTPKPRKPKSEQVSAHDHDVERAAMMIEWARRPIRGMS